MNKSVGSADAREAIFSSIRKNLEVSEAKDLLDGYSTATVRSAPSARVELSESLPNEFKRNLESVGASCHIGSVESAAKYIQDLVDTGQIKTAAVSNSPLIASVAGMINGLEFSADLTKDELFEVSAGITEAQWGIAETGTVVLDSGVERNRLASAVPPVHICLISADRIRRTMSEILALVASHLSPTVTFITGASRTSDIELTLAIGVHGPGELHVLVIE